MNHVNYTDFRANLAAHMDTVCDDRDALLVTRQRGRSVVVVAAEEWESVQETLHLLKSARNAASLRAAIDELEAGEGTERPLAE